MTASKHLTFETVKSAFSSGLGRRLVFSTIALSTILAFVVTSLQLFIEYRQEVGWVKQRMHLIENLHKHTLEQSLWQMDEQMVQIQLQGIVSLPDVKSLVLKRPGVPELEMTSEHHQGVIMPKVWTYPLSYHDGHSETNLGSLEVTTSLARVIYAMGNRVLIVLASNFAKTLLVACFILYLFQSLVGKHLVAAAQAVSAPAFSEHGGLVTLKRPAGRQKDELDMLVDAYNEASRSLRETMVELRTANESLLVAKDQAEELNRAKSIFLANVSHEIRTPLTAIQGFSELLANGKIPDQEEVARIHQRILRNTMTLRTLVDELLDHTKIEAGEFEVVKAEVLLADLLDGVHSEFEPQLQSKELEFIWDVPTENGLKVVTDPVLFSKIARNLLGNAMKFTRSGFISFKVWLVEETEHRILNIEVADSGIGIKRDVQQKIFSAFYQQDETIARDFGGTGLGLTLAKKCANHLGGDLILVSSELGVGSKFRASFPA